MGARAEAPVERVSARAYAVPTDAPEADGTSRWDRTTLVLAEVVAAGQTGIGYTYADAGIVGLVRGALARAIRDVDAPRLYAAGAVPGLRHPGRIRDRACIEPTPFDGAAGPQDGITRPELGLRFKRADAEPCVAG